MVLSLFPFISLSLELVPKSPSTNFLLVGTSFLGKPIFPSKVNISYSSFKALKGYFKDPKALMLSSHNLAFFLKWDGVLANGELERLLTTSFYSISSALLEVPWFFHQVLVLRPSFVFITSFWIPGAWLWQDFFRSPSFQNKHALSLDHLLSY